ncbi:MAG TPA: AMP-binding protein [Polyangiaceae bacterium]|nr:AMP-binding protein [Polyangiaceae bacterium]
MSDPETILDWAVHWEQQTPDRLHFIQPLGGGATHVATWTFAQALREARRMASHLRSLNLPSKSRVAIVSKNCAHWILADWAIWMADLVSVPLYPNLNASTVRYILEHSDARLLFVGKLDPIWEEMKQGVPEGLPRVAFPLAPPGSEPRWDDVIAQHEPLAEPARRSADEMATIVYTSGSTGLPKGAMISFGAMAAATRGIIQVLEITEADRMLSYLPMAHTMERWLIECTSTQAAFQVYFAESVDTFLQDLQRARPTLFLSVPRLWLKFQAGVLKKMPAKKLDRLLSIPIVGGLVKRKVLKGLGLDAARIAGSGSAPVPAELIAWYRKLGLELLEGYGMTENFNYSHVSRPGRVRVGYVGEPYDDVQCRISPEGEVLVKSPGLMLGYFKQPEETRAAFTEDGFLKTGDRGSIDELGRLRITGRVKELFKTSKGKYVAPAPIENQILNHPRIEQCCVSGAGQPQPYALVVLNKEAWAAVKDGAKAQVESELAQHVEQVNQGLEAFEQLEFACVVKGEWLPENGFLTPSLKLKRSRVEEAYSPHVPGWYAQRRKVVWAEA